MPTINYLYFLKILYANLDKLDDLMSLAAELVAAPTLLERWRVIKEIGDILASANMPSEGEMSAFQTDDFVALESAVTARLAGHGFSAQAWDGTRLRRLFDTLLPVLVQVLPLLLK